MTKPNLKNIAPAEKMDGFANDKQKECYILEAEILKNLELFGNFSEDAIKVFLNNCNEILLDEGEILIAEGLPADKMYIILAGKVSIHKGQKRIAVLQAGDFVGEMSLINAADRAATATAVSKKALLIEVGEDQFKQFLISNPTAMFSMMKTLSSRIRGDLTIMASEMQRVGNFTHDMRNILVPLGMAEVYLDDVGDVPEEEDNNPCSSEERKKIKKSLGIIQAVRNNLIVMIDQSLACAKRTQEKHVKDDFEVSPLLKEVVDEISCHKNLKNKNIQVSVKGEVPKAHFNYLDIKRVLQNLLINAGHASEADSTIDVQCKSLNDCIQIIVKDYGAGIPEDVKPLLLKENHTTKSDGNGFGLMSCKEIIEDLHQGAIHFESEVGEGTSFFFTIPHCK
jgi:signal transduction histidine kinase